VWYVYVIQSQQLRVDKKGRKRPGFYYVGCTTCPSRRLKEHNGKLSGGGKYTSMFRPWVARALYGPYEDRSAAMKAERALKKGKRGAKRAAWSPKDSSWCRGLGPNHPWVSDPTWEENPSR